jgi:serine/threonine-protein phosphatase 6 regulatory ankyrin repeat subunit A
MLHLAAASGGLQMMQWLLDAGVDVNMRTEFGKTPLMFSVESGSVPAMVLLLRSGAMREINVVDRDGNTALHIAARKASVEFAQLLLACGNLTY